MARGPTTRPRAAQGQEEPRTRQLDHGQGSPNLTLDGQATLIRVYGWIPRPGTTAHHRRRKPARLAGPLDRQH